MPILHKRNTTSGVIPTTSSLLVGELAINVADGKLFGRRSGSTGDTIVSYLASDVLNTGSYTISGTSIVSGSLVLSGLPSASVVDRSDSVFPYANNATVDFPSFSGMILFNNQSASGTVTMVLCGGGSVTKIGASGTGTGTGSFSYVSGINGYRWTNDTGGTISASFAAIKTRNFA